MPDQDRISPYNINTISKGKVMRERWKINFFTGLSVDPIPNYPKQHNENCMADSKENY